MTFFTDRDVRAQLSASHLETKGISYDFFLPPPETQTFKVSKSDPYMVIISHVCRALSCDISEVGVWACEALKSDSNLIRIGRPLDNVDITHCEEKSGKTGAGIATVGDVLAGLGISQEFIYVDVLNSDDIVSLNSLSGSYPYVRLCDEDDENGQQKSQDDGGGGDVSLGDVLENYQFHPKEELKIHHIIKLEKCSGGTRFRLVAKIYKDALLVNDMEHYARTNLGISRPWVYGLKIMCEGKSSLVGWTASEKKSSIPLTTLVYVQEAVEDVDKPFKNTANGRPENMKVCLFNKAHTFRIDFRPRTHDDGEECSLIVNTLKTIKEVESFVGESFGFDLTLTPSDPFGNPGNQSLSSSSTFQSDFIKDKRPGQRFAYYHKKVQGLKVGIWEGGQLKVNVAKVDEFTGVVEDVTKDLGEGNWRILFLRDGDFVETVRRGERLQAYFHHAASRGATKAVVKTGDLGALDYNNSGSKGAVEDVVFAAEKIDDVGELEVGEGVRTTAVPLVVEIGVKEQEGLFTTFGVPLLSHLKEEDTAEFLTERICTKTGLSSAGATVYILGARRGGTNRPHEGALWGEVKTQFGPVSLCEERSDDLNF